MGNEPQAVKKSRTLKLGSECITGASHSIHSDACLVRRMDCRSQHSCCLHIVMWVSSGKGQVTGGNPVATTFIYSDVSLMFVTALYWFSLIAFVCTRDTQPHHGSCEEVFLLKKISLSFFLDSSFWIALNEACHVETLRQLILMILNDFKFLWYWLNFLGLDATWGGKNRRLCAILWV